MAILLKLDDRNTSAYQEGLETMQAYLSGKGYINTDNPYCMEDPRYQEFARGMQDAKAQA